MANFQQIGAQFVKLYYEAFDSNRRNLAPLYVSLVLCCYINERVTAKCEIRAFGDSIMFQFCIYPLFSLKNHNMLECRSFLRC